MMKKEYFVVLELASDENKHLGTFWFGMNGSIGLGSTPFQNFKDAEKFAKFKIKEEENNHIGHVTELKIVSREVAPWTTKKIYIS